MRSLRPLVVLAVFSCMSALPAARAQAPAAGAPAEFKIGFVDFLSGAAATYGTSTRHTAEWLVDKWNREGGIRGAKVRLVVVDESGPADKQVGEFRRLALDEKVDAVVGYTSAGNCLAIAPIAEELKVLTVLHVCGASRLTEDRQLKYVFRAANHQAADSVIGARYLLAMKPDLKTVAAVNEDYAWGRDSWGDFKAALLQLKPDVKIVGELWTKFQAGEYSAEISRLLAAKPDIIHSSIWGGGLITFVKQAGPRGLFKESVVYFSPGEAVLQDLKRDMPDGVVLGPRSTPGYFLYPDPGKNALAKDFIDGLKAKTGRYPDFTAHRTYQALAGLKAAYEKAADQAGRWPSKEQVATAFSGLTWQAPYGPITMRSDHQAVHGGIVGVSKFDPQLGFARMDRVSAFRAEQIMPPLGVKTPDWLKTLK